MGVQDSVKNIKVNLGRLWLLEMENYRKLKMSCIVKRYQIIDAEGNKKAWKEWQNEFMKTEMYQEFCKLNRNQEVDWEQFMDEYYS